MPPKGSDLVFDHRHNAAVRIAADGRAVGDGLAGGEDAEGMPAVAA
jgi:hypothetical protein